jgi:hypothetical protein
MRMFGRETSSKLSVSQEKSLKFFRGPKSGSSGRPGYTDPVYRALPPIVSF